MKNYHGDLKRVTRKGGAGEKETKRGEENSKVNVHLLFPVSLNQFPIFIRQQ